MDYFDKDELKSDLIADAPKNNKLIIESHGNDMYGRHQFDDGNGHVVDQDGFLSTLPSEFAAKVVFYHRSSPEVTTNWQIDINKVRSDYHLPPKNYP